MSKLTVFTTVEQFLNNDSVITTLYVTDEKLKRINDKFSVSPENTYDYRHEYLDTTTVCNLVSTITKIKFTTVERHFRSWRAGRRALRKRLDNITASTQD